MARTDTLEVLADIAREAGLSFIADASLAIAERLRAGLFYVVCVGQFKRGKSTLVNALVGAPLLPTGVVPVTSAVTIVRYGEHPSARVRFKGGDRDDCDPTAIGRYVSEEHNPGNRRGVVAVEVAVPSPLLARGLCLVDTPGLGSVVRANLEATRQFLPHIDAALLVLGSDSPVPQLPDVIWNESSAGTLAGVHAAQHHDRAPRHRHRRSAEGQGASPLALHSGADFLQVATSDRSRSVDDDRSVRRTLQRSPR